MVLGETGYEPSIKNLAQEGILPGVRTPQWENARAMPKNTEIRGRREH